MIDSNMRGHRSICSVVVAAMKHKRCLSSLKTGVVDIIVGGDIDSEIYVNGEDSLVVCMKDHDKCEEDSEEVGYLDIRRIRDNGSLDTEGHIDDVDTKILPKLNTPVFNIKERYMMWHNHLENCFYRFDYRLAPSPPLESIEYDMPPFAQQVQTDCTSCKRCGLIVELAMYVDHGKIEFSLVNYANHKNSVTTTALIQLSEDLSKKLSRTNLHDAHLIPSKEDARESPECEGLDGPDRPHCRHHYLFFTCLQRSEIIMCYVPTMIVDGAQLTVSKVFDTDNGKDLYYRQYSKLHFVDNFTLAGRIHENSGCLEIVEVMSGLLHRFSIPNANGLVELGQVYSILSCRDTIKVIMTYTGEVVLSCAFGVNYPALFFGTSKTEWLNDFRFYGSTCPVSRQLIETMGHAKLDHLVWQIVSFTTCHVHEGVKAKAIVGYFDLVRY